MTISPRIARLAGFCFWLILYTASIEIGRMTIVPEIGLALIWPAVGIGVAWIVRTPPRSLLTVVAAVFASNLVSGLLRGADFWSTFVFGIAHTAQAMLIGVLFLRLVRHTGRDGRRDPFRHPKDLLTLLACGFVGAAVTSPVALVGARILSGRWSPEVPVAWMIRNPMSVVVITTAMCGTIALWEHRATWVSSLHKRGREYVALCAAGAVLSLVAFVPEFGASATTGALALTVWVGSRFRPHTVGISSFLLVVVVIVASLSSGHGPFASVDDALAQAVSVQVFLGVTILTGMFLSLAAEERARMQGALHQARRRDRSRLAFRDAIVKGLIESVVAVDAQGDVVFRNRPSGPLPARGSSHHFSDLSGRRLDPEELPISRALRGEPVQGQRLVDVTPGTDVRRVISVNAIPLDPANDGDEGAPAAVVVVRDVTEEQQQFEQLQSFAGSVAHDLNNPLAAVLGFTQLSRDSLADLDLAEGERSSLDSLLGRVEGGARRMHQLVTDLLELSVAQSSELRTERLDLHDTLGALVAEVGETCPTASFEVAGEVAVLQADPVMIRQVFLNLLRNSVKYTPAELAPHIAISVSNGDRRCLIEISDNGTGIPEGEHGTIFEPFVRASTHRTLPGTGLGLAIVARAVQRHAGHIEAFANQTGCGTTFRFDLPLADPTPADPAPADPAPADPAAADPTHAAVPGSPTEAVRPTPLLQGACGQR